MPRLNLQMFHGPCLFLIYTLPHSRIVSCQEKQQENATAAQRPTKCARKRWPSRQKKIRKKGSCSCRQTAWPAESDSNAQPQKRVPLACRSFRYLNFIHTAMISWSNTTELDMWQGQTGMDQYSRPGPRGPQILFMVFMVNINHLILATIDQHMKTQIPSILIIPEIFYSIPQKYIPSILVNRYPIGEGAAELQDHQLLAPLFSSKMNHSP